MKAKNGKQVTRGLLTSLLGVAACFVAVPLGHTQTGADTSVAQSPAGNPDPTPSGSSGWKVYVDPQTGVIRDGPAPGTVPAPLSPQEQNALSTSTEGLVLVPSPQSSAWRRHDDRPPGSLQEPASSRSITERHEIR